MMEVAMAARDEEFAVMLVVQNVAHLRTSDLCNLTAGQIIRPSSWALLLNRRVRRKRLAGRSSFDRNRQSIDEIHSWQSSDDSPLELSSSKVRSGFCQMGVHVITIHSYSVRHGGASSDALWRTRSLMEIQKRGRWRSERSMLGCSKKLRNCRQPRESLGTS